MVIRRRTRDNRAYRTEVVWRMIRPQDVRARDAQSDFTTGQRQGLGATLNAQQGDQVLVLLVLQPSLSFIVCLLLHYRRGTF